MNKKQFFAMKEQILKLELNDGDVLILPNEMKLREWNHLIELCRPMMKPKRIFYGCGPIEKLDKEQMNKAGWFMRDQLLPPSHKEDIYDAAKNKSLQLGFPNVIQALFELEKLMVKK